MPIPLISTEPYRRIKSLAEALKRSLDANQGPDGGLTVQLIDAINELSPAHQAELKITADLGKISGGCYLCDMKSLSLPASNEDMGGYLAVKTPLVEYLDEGERIVLENGQKCEIHNPDNASH